MIVRNFVIALSVTAFLAGSIQQSKASPQEVVPAAASTGAGIWVAGGIIGVAAVLCAYDLVLKINGVKNWDGTEKVVATKKRRH